MWSVHLQSQHFRDRGKQIRNLRLSPGRQHVSGYPVLYETLERGGMAPGMNSHEFTLAQPILEDTNSVPQHLPHSWETRSMPPGSLP